MLPSLPHRWLPPPAHLAAVSIVSALTAWAGIVLSWQADNLAGMWFTNGILLAVLLTRPPRHWPALLAAGLAGGGFVSSLLGEPLPSMLVMQFSNAIDITAPALLLRHRRGASPDLTRRRSFFEFLAVAVVLTPIVSGLLAVQVLALLWHQPFLPLLARWCLADALGIAVMTPLTLSLLRGDLVLLLIPPAVGRTLLVVGSYLLVILLAFTRTRVPLLFLPFPPLVLVVATLGMPGAGLILLPTAVVGFAITAAGHGPMMLIPGLPPEQRLEYMQIYLLVAAATAYAIGIIVAERRRLNQALLDQNMRLARSERLYRLLANNASDIITRVRLDGRRLYVSPSAQEVLGWSVEEMLRGDWQNNVHPDDFTVFESVRDRMRAGAKDAGATYRYRRKDGGWTWIEARAHLVEPSDGVASEFIGILRDVTRQKDAEFALEAVLAELSQQATTDVLTGIPNRRRFDEMLAKEWRRGSRIGDPLSLLLIDVDHFKAYNDRYGHQSGDECLRTIAATLAAVIRRPHDLVARYGGEEFVAVLPATTREGAEQLAETLRAAVAALVVPHAAALRQVVTVSIGVATVVPDSDKGAADLIEAADAALYAAKRGGRNRVALAPGTLAQRELAQFAAD